MKPTLADQLKDIKINFHQYGRLPSRENVYIIDNNPMQKQWEKLLLLRKNLKIVDKYINSNTQQSLKEWIYLNNNEGISQIVLDKIGDKNNVSGGISAYYYNLQEFYDKEENKYDELEKKPKIPTSIQKIINDFRAERQSIQKSRIKIRKLKKTELKKEGKGFFMVDYEEPEKVNEEKKNITNLPLPSNNNIGVWIAGTLITITVISTFVSLTTKNK